jgi:hypothetical protein
MDAYRPGVEVYQQVTQLLWPLPIERAVVEGHLIPQDSVQQGCGMQAYEHVEARRFEGAAFK